LGKKRPKIRKWRGAADRDSRKIITGNEIDDYYENANCQSKKSKGRRGRAPATNDRGPNQPRREDSERSGSGVDPDKIHPGTDRFFGAFKELSSTYQPPTHASCY